MKKTSLFIATALLATLPVVSAAEESAPVTPVAVPAPAAAPAAQPLSPEQVAKNIGYLFGYQTGQQMSQIGPVDVADFEAQAFMDGLKAGLAGDKPAISEEEVGKAFSEYQKVIQGRVAAKAKANIDAGKTFLAENAKKEGVVTTASGLQYKVLEKGGDKKYEAPKGGDKGTRFLVNYKGTLPDGTVFDETKGNPVPMPLEVIPGFKEALVMMPVGAKWELVLPSELAYGEQGAGGKIGPSQVLRFELELKDILPPDEKAINNPMESVTPEQLQEMLNQAAKDQGAK